MFTPTTRQLKNLENIVKDKDLKNMKVISESRLKNIIKKEVAKALAAKKRAR